jgi:predicted alpha/beta-hydrolase family hydrolase
MMPTVIAMTLFYERRRQGTMKQENQPAPFLSDGPERVPVTLVLAHGAGAPMDSPFMETVAKGLGERGARVVRFEFPYMHARRTGVRKGPDRQAELRRSWLEVIERVGGRGGAKSLVIGGKSLGGRIASLVADEAGVGGLVCLGYPFHPPGQPERLRTAHLATLKTPALILQGTRDPFGPKEDVAGYDLSPNIRVIWIEDGDHSFKPRKGSGRTEGGNMREVIEAVAAFLGK